MRLPRRRLKKGVGRILEQNGVYDLWVLAEKSLDSLQGVQNRFGAFPTAQKLLHTSVRVLIGTVIRKIGYLSLAKFEEYLQFDPDFHEEALFGNLEDTKGVRRRKGRPFVSDRFRILAIKAFQKKKISPEKLSELLNQDKDKIVLSLAKS